MTAKFVTHVSGRLGGTDLVDHVTFTWDDEESMAITMTIHATFPNGAKDTACWHMARDLVDLALTRPGTQFGLGDVRLEADEDTLYFDLTAQDESQHRLVVERKPVLDLMIQSYLVVPAGSDRVAVDEAIDQILGETA